MSLALPSIISDESLDHCHSGNSDLGNNRSSTETISQDPVSSEDLNVNNKSALFTVENIDDYPSYEVYL
jgi:hypothetical protein